MILQVTLPWPNKVLSPNSRAHWRARHAAAKSYKHTAWVMAKHSMGRREAPSEGALMVRLTFCPPNAIRRDVDNMLASMKAALDGIALALGVDDSRFRYELSRESPLKGGRVVITVEAA